MGRPGVACFVFCLAARCLAARLLGGDWRGRRVALGADADRRRGDAHRPHGGWVSGLGVEVGVKGKDAGGSWWSVWPSLSCLGLELAAARGVGAVADPADRRCVECGVCCGVGVPPPPRCRAGAWAGARECRRVARTVELARRCSGRLCSSKTQRCYRREPDGGVRERGVACGWKEMNGVDGGGCSRVGSCGGRPVLGRGVLEARGRGR